MKIEIWSDVVCPYCYIGKRHLEHALEGVSEIDAKIEWKSFELDPNSPKQTDQDIYERLAEKYGQTEAWARQMAQRVSDMASEVGLHYNMSKVKPVNSFDAHRLLHFAKETGRQDELKERFLKAYFEEGALISDHKVLTKLAGEVGFDKELIKKTLSSSDFTEEVREDFSRARSIGVQGVPFFLINEKYGLSGAQPVSTMQEALKRIHEKETE